MNDQPTKIRLSKTVLWVTLAHFVVLLVIGFWPARKIDTPPQMTMIEMIDAVSTTPSSKGPAPEPKIATGPVLGKPGESEAAPQTTKPAPPSKPADPIPEPPKPEPAPQTSPPPVEKKPEPPTVEPTPSTEPASKTDDFAIKEPKKEVKKESPEKKPASTPPKKTPVKINLKEVVRSGDSSPSSPTSSKANKSSAISPSSSKSSSNSNSSSPEISSEEITSRLGSAIGKGGSGGAVLIGPLSTPGGGTGNFGSYFDLIRKQMYGAWNRPVHLTQKELSALVKITIENDGGISNVTLVSGSGIRDFDESILEAARRVRKIREPLPEGLNHEITIRFKFDD